MMRFNLTRPCVFPVMQCATIASNTLHIAMDGYQSGTHSANKLFFKVVPDAEGFLSPDEKFANAVDRLDFVLGK